MKVMNRRQAAGGLLMLALSAVAGAAQHRPRHPAQHHSPGQARPQPKRPSGEAPKQMGSAQAMRQGRVRDEDIYGSQMMSAEERERYKDRLQQAQSDREWAQIRAEHQEEIRRRAEEMGKPIDPPIYGQHMMSAEERARYTQRMQDAAGAAEREQIQKEHREFIRDRARELGLEPPAPQD
jgi:hypothetical protein